MSHIPISDASREWRTATAAQLNELVRSTRLAALREAYHAAAGAHRGPVGASDGGTYICGTNADAARAIKKLIDEASK
jgi:hypothetical protein